MVTHGGVAPQDVYLAITRIADPKRRSHALFSCMQFHADEYFRDPCNLAAAAAGVGGSAAVGTVAGPLAAGASGCGRDVGEGTGLGDGGGRGHLADVIQALAAEEEGVGAWSLLLEAADQVRADQVEGGVG